MKKLIDKDLFRVDEVSEYFSITKKTVYILIENGNLEAVKIGGSIRIKRQSVIDCQIPKNTS